MVDQPTSGRPPISLTLEEAVAEIGRLREALVEVGELLESRDNAGFPPWVGAAQEIVADVLWFSPAALANRPRYLE